MRPGIHDINRLKVLKTLRRAGPICRTDLARMVDLTGGTITEISGDLIKRGLVIEQRVSSPGKRGRPRVDLHIDPSGAFVLGAYLKVGGWVTCEIVDLMGGKLFTHVEKSPDPLSLENWTDRITAIIDKAIIASPFPRDVIRHVGLGLPAVVDAEHGIVHWPEPFSGEPKPVAEIIGQAIGIPVSIDNETHLLARAEHWFGDDPLMDDFLLVNIGLGLSTGRYSDGILVAGAHGFNPEWSHMKIVPEGGRACSCGATGCLQAYSSISGMVDTICEVKGLDRPAFPDMVAFLADAVRQSQAGDGEIVAILERAGRYLGIAMANLINGLDPGRLLLLAPTELVPQGLSNRVFASLEENVIPVLRGRTRVEFRSFNDDLYREGAAALVLERIYRSG